MTFEKPSVCKTYWIMIFPHFFTVALHIPNSIVASVVSFRDATSNLSKHCQLSFENICFLSFHVYMLINY